MQNIHFISISIENWIEIRNKKNYTFWIINEDDECITGYFDGFDTLNDKEVDQFLTYRNYYYYKSLNSSLELSNYIKYEDDDMIEINSIQNENTLNHMINIRRGLIKEINVLNGMLNKSNIMNGINFG